MRWPWAKHDPARMKTVREVEKDVTARLRRLGAPWLDPPHFGDSPGYEGTHIEVKDGLYHYVFVERGEEQSRKSSASYDDLLYWIFTPLTRRFASYVLEYRSEDSDHKQLVFSKQIELMQLISPKLGERLESEKAQAETGN
jgi:hypothetical protein